MQLAVRTERAGKAIKFSDKDLPAQAGSRRSVSNNARFQQDANGVWGTRLGDLFQVPRLLSGVERWAT